MISFKPPLPGARVARALAEVQRFLAHTGVKAVAGLSGSVGKSIHSQGVVVVVGDRVKGRGYLGGKEIQRRSIEAFLPQPGYALLKSHEQALLEEHGVNFAGCLEKSELQGILAAVSFRLSSTRRTHTSPERPRHTRAASVICLLRSFGTASWSFAKNP